MRQGLALAVVLLVQPALAQDAHLDTNEVRRAIAYGSTRRIEQTGLRLPLRKGGIGWFLLADKWHRDTAKEQGVTIFTPTSWVYRAAAEANQRLRPFSASDVKPDDLSPVLRVFTNVGVERIGIRRAPDSSDILWPVRTERYEGLIPYRGDNLATTNMLAVFSLADLDRLRDRHPTREFTVVVIAMGEPIHGAGMNPKALMTLHVVVEEKYFKELP